MKTLDAFLQDSAIDSDLAKVISKLAHCCETINTQLQRGELAGILGSAGAANVQGETQKKLDVIANDLLKEALKACPSVRGIASEEEDEVVGANADGRFLVTYDPLDGSSNIDINSMVGTIFSVLGSEASGPVTEAEFLQPGRDQKAAGYVLYGPSMMLVFSTGDGVTMFTFDPEQNSWLQTVERVELAPDTKEFAINMSNHRFWAEPMRAYIDDLLKGSDGPRGKNFNMRWVAAMVADVHRILCRGGLFTYPWDSRKPDQAGKLRLMYEANPMGLLVEQAGGEAWTDSVRILDIQPEQIHQRVPVILGSANEVKCCVEYHQR
ncbi:fructose-1,6-bisphosphatase I [Litorivivens lipolytica]|uniref:Fructose-1,6-bisphosphatase class 1 n=1 Tax=Litorivivens lipolytica TaxID=1524264 RepID=A0A7W4W6D5_9GAMM|nr:class 1 fructose-bisphosphatase [Litorivivens lipolytica]MBB3048306.1 fructose-1,6-bisphosphatase I [Litorivivens lipolytica]